jgi:hypothetical protein
MLLRLKNTWWLSSVKTVALKRENTQTFKTICNKGFLRVEGTVSGSRSWMTVPSGIPQGEYILVIKKCASMMCKIPVPVIYYTAVGKIVNQGFTHHFSTGD